MTGAGTIPGRACGSCTLCCKLLEIDELGKPGGGWCAHCAIGKGCRVYDTRPEACRGFFCGWLTLPIMDDKWFPAKCRMMVFPSPRGDSIAVHVDSGRPNAWREEPFLSEIRTWARVAAGKVQVLVCVGRRTIAIMPDGEIDLGVVAPGESVVTEEAFENGRMIRRARKVKN